jgi:hypothetical protein
MKPRTIAAERAGTTSRAIDALGYEAPFLIEKLLKERIVDTAESGEVLFSEVKKYLVLAHSGEKRIWDMYSVRVDEAWHQFILFTEQYSEFCHRFFGRYLHHRPSNAPEGMGAKTKGGKAIPRASFARFRERYTELFGSPLPSIWYDERSVAPERRVLNDRAGTLIVRQAGDMIDLIDPSGDVLFSVNDFGRDALAFIARTPAFHVRELPGGLDDDEKVALVAALVGSRVLRVSW